MEVEIYNPNEKEIEELPVIYGFANGVNPFGVSAVLIAEDGTPLGSHFCSDEWWARNDLGINKGSRSDRHKTFREHYPDGYIMEFVPSDKIEGHTKLMASIEIANARPTDAEEKGSWASVTVTRSEDESDG